MRDGGNAEILAIIFDSYSSSNSFSFRVGEDSSSFVNYINFTGLSFAIILLFEKLIRKNSWWKIIDYNDFLNKEVEAIEKRLGDYERGRWEVPSGSSSNTDDDGDFFGVFSKTFHDLSIYLLIFWGHKEKIKLFKFYSWSDTIFQPISNF